MRSSFLIIISEFVTLFHFILSFQCTFNRKLPFPRNRLILKIKDVTSASGSVISPPKPKLRDTKNVSKRLLELLLHNNHHNIKTSYTDIESYINELETNYIPIQTISFLTFALQGKWKLQYSNFFTPTKIGINMSVDIYQDIQVFDTQGRNVVLGEEPIGNITNIIKYNAYVNTSSHSNSKDSDSLLNTVGSLNTSPSNSSSLKNYKGELHVQSNYTSNTKGELWQDLFGHLLLPKTEKDPSASQLDQITDDDDDGGIPPDPSAFVFDLQSAVPLDLFDTSELYLQHTYIDPFLRIVRVGNAQGITGIIHIFTRNNPDVAK